MISPPTNVTVSDVPDDQGHSLAVSWDASVSDYVEWFRIYRSRSGELTEPVVLSGIESLDDLLVIEQTYTVLIDSVAADMTEYIDEYVPIDNVPYYYWIQAVGGGGASAKIAAEFVTQVQEHPRQFVVEQPYPNPFNPTTTIKYTIPDNSRVRIVVYDVLGREVRTLVDTYKGAGSYQSVWNARDNDNSPVSSGVYIFRVSAGNYKHTEKCMFIR